MGLLITLESSLNRIFEAPRSRAVARRIVLYWATITLGPILIVAAQQLFQRAVDVSAGVPGIEWVVSGLGSIATALVGMFVGAGRADLIREIVIYTILRAEVFALVIGVIFWIFAPQLAGWFTEDPEIIDIAAQYLRVICWAFPFVTIGIINGRVFQGLGSGMPGLVLTSLRVVLISVPAAWTLTQVFDYGLLAVWISLAAAGLVTSVLAVVWVHFRLRRVEAELQVDGAAG